MTSRYKYLVALEAEAGQTQDEASRSLRAFLKAALRQWGLKCTSATQITPSPTAEPLTTTAKETD